MRKRAPARGGGGAGAWARAAARPVRPGHEQQQQEELLPPHLVGAAGQAPGRPDAAPGRRLTRPSVSLRFRRQRKAVVSAGDKKMPNGILEEQGTQRGAPRRSRRGAPSPGCPRWQPPGFTVPSGARSPWCEAAVGDAPVCGFAGGAPYPVCVASPGAAWPSRCARQGRWEEASPAPASGSGLSHRPAGRL